MSVHSQQYMTQISHDPRKSISYGNSVTPQHLEWGHAIDSKIITGWHGLVVSMPFNIIV
jgi:hypothetical protein